mgnify:CR=1 FL=1
MTPPRLGELWVAKLPGVKGELLVVVVDAQEREQLYGCAVLDATLALPYGVGTVHAWPLTSNDCWRRVANE